MGVILFSSNSGRSITETLNDGVKIDNLRVKTLVSGNNYVFPK